MTYEILNLGEIRYNPTCAAFETLARVFDGVTVHSYPVHIIAPLHADYEVINRGLTQRALEAHRNKAHGLQSRRAQNAELPMELARSLAA